MRVVLYVESPWLKISRVELAAGLLPRAGASKLCGPAMVLGSLGRLGTEAAWLQTRLLAKPNGGHRAFRVLGPAAVAGVFGLVAARVERRHFVGGQEKGSKHGAKITPPNSMRLLLRDYLPLLWQVRARVFEGVWAHWLALVAAWLRAGLHPGGADFAVCAPARV